MRNRCLLLGLISLGVCLFMPQKSVAQSTISCNSDDMKRHYCAVDTRGGVQLVTQRSDSACTEGYTWGSDNQGIWVDRGCRADFSVGRSYQDRNDNYRDQNGGNGQSQTIACNSDDMRRHSCSVNTQGGVRLVKQRSDAACTKGYSWGSNRRGIWVDHGCRADFVVGQNNNDRHGSGDYQNSSYRGNEQSQTIACNSDDMRRHSCSVNTQGGVRLLTQRSDAACTEGYSWGSDNQGIWVDHGCRADFAVNTNYR